MALADALQTLFADINDELLRRRELREREIVRLESLSNEEVIELEDEEIFSTIETVSKIISRPMPTHALSVIIQQMFSPDVNQSAIQRFANDTEKYLSLSNSLEKTSEGWRRSSGVH